MAGLSNLIELARGVWNTLDSIDSSINKQTESINKQNEILLRIAESMEKSAKKKVD